MQEKMAKYLIDILGDQLLMEPLPNFPVLNFPLRLNLFQSKLNLIINLSKKA